MIPNVATFLCEAHLRSGVRELLKLEELVAMCDCKVAAAALTSEIFEYPSLPQIPNDSECRDLSEN